MSPKECGLNLGCAFERNMGDLYLFLPGNQLGGEVGRAVRSARAVGRFLRILAGIGDQVL